MVPINLADRRLPRISPADAASARVEWLYRNSRCRLSTKLRHVGGWILMGQIE